MTYDFIKDLFHRRMACTPFGWSLAKRRLALVLGYQSEDVFDALSICEDSGFLREQPIKKKSCIALAQRMVDIPREDWYKNLDSNCCFLSFGGKRTFGEVARSATALNTREALVVYPIGLEGLFA